MLKLRFIEFKIAGIYFTIWIFGRSFNKYRFLPKHNGFDHYYFLDYEIIIYSINN